MTALGVGVSSKDQTHDWTGLVSGHKLTAAIYDADQEAKRAWDFFTANVDDWISAKYAARERGDEYAAVEAQNKIYYYEDKAQMATEYAQLLRKQRYCTHRTVRYLDSENEVRCIECNAELSIHTSSIADNNAEITF